MPEDDPRFADVYDADLGATMLEMSRRVTGVPEYLGIELVGIGPGWVAGEMSVRPELLNPFGAMHGAAVAALVDHVLGSCVYPLVPRGTWPATLEFKLNYLAPVREGVVRAESRVTALTKRTAVVHVDVLNDGRTVATALGTISLNPPKSDG
jgi:1,4-dihydroxy-2-naphthoyl-CoA hydrolase